MRPNKSVTLTAAQYDAKYGKIATRDAIRAGFWAKGNLQFLLHKGQKELLAAFHAQKPKKAVWNIGRRYGKSFALCVLATETALKHPNCRVVYAGATQVSLEQFVYPIMRRILATCPERLKPKMVDNEIRFHNGSIIVMQGCKDIPQADRLRGPASKLAIVDEAGFIPVLDYVINSVLQPQLMDPDTGETNKMVIASSPPRSPAHYFRELAREAEVRGVYHHKTMLDSPIWNATQIAEQMEEAGGPDSLVWNREYLAKFMTDSKYSLVPEFEKYESVIVVDDYPRPLEHDRYTIIDNGFVDLCAVLFASYDFPNAILYIENELFLQHSLAEDIGAAVLTKEEEIWPDPLGPFATQSWKADAQPQALATLSKRTSHHFVAVNNREVDACINSLCESLREGRKIRINKRCVGLISHLRHGVWNSQRTKVDRVEGFGHFDGVMAAAYLNRHTDWSHNPASPVYPNKYENRIPSHLKQDYFPSAAAQRAATWKSVLSNRGKKERR